MKAVMDKYNDKWHIGEKMLEMKNLRGEILKTMTYEEYRKKQIETLNKVIDYFKEKGVACNGCHSMPWIFYGVYSFEECVKILLTEGVVVERKDGE